MRIGIESVFGHKKLAEFFEWKVIKMEGGEIDNRYEKVGKKKKEKKRGFLERAVEGITGAFIVYLSASATVEVTKGVLLLAGIILVIYAVIPD